MSFWNLVDNIEYVCTLIWISNVHYIPDQIWYGDWWWPWRVHIRSIPWTHTRRPWRSQNRLEKRPHGDTKRETLKTIRAPLYQYAKGQRLYIAVGISPMQGLGNPHASIGIITEKIWGSPLEAPTPKNWLLLWYGICLTLNTARRNGTATEGTRKKEKKSTPHFLFRAPDREAGA